MTTRTHTVIDSRIGPLTLVADGNELVGLYMHQQRRRPAPETFGAPDDEPFAEVIRQLGEYFAGRRTDFDLRLRLNGTPFQQRVWAALREIPYGEVTSYGALAQQIGQLAAARAVGLANGKNPISIIVPCHPVVGAQGQLTGYGGGWSASSTSSNSNGSPASALLTCLCRKSSPHDRPTAGLSLSTWARAWTVIVGLAA